jgi:hypothetical protein
MLRNVRSRLRLLGVLALTILVARDGVAQLPPPLPNVGPPLILRLDGVWQPTRAAARAVGFTVASFAFLGDEQARTLWLGVTEARTVGGDNPVDGKDVLNAVAPFVPNLLIVGPKDLVARLRSAAPGTRLRIEGLVDRGSRTYYLRRIEFDAEPTARRPRPPHSGRA